jgi:hypothetical protein
MLSPTTLQTPASLVTSAAPSASFSSRYDTTAAAASMTQSASAAFPRAQPVSPKTTSPSPGIASSQLPGLVTRKTGIIEVVDSSEETQPEGCTKTMAEIKSLVTLLVSHAETVPEADQPMAVQNFFAKFAKSMASLEMLVTNYPFLVEEHPLHPALCYQKMKAWEDHLFSKLPNKPEAIRIRKSKNVEIRKAKAEEVPQLAAAVFVSLEKAAAAAAKLKQQMTHQSAMSTVLEDIRKRGEMAEKKRLEQLRQEALAASGGQDEEIDFGN